VYILVTITAATIGAVVRACAMAVETGSRAVHDAQVGTPLVGTLETRRAHHRDAVLVVEVHVVPV